MTQCKPRRFLTRLAVALADMKKMIRAAFARKEVLDKMGLPDSLSLKEHLGELPGFVKTCHAIHAARRGKPVEAI